MKKIVVIIPARFASARFPGKPLAEINGKPLIQHVVERVKDSKIDDLIVATDSMEIKDVLKRIGCKVLMTKKEHPSGTDRIAEVAKNIDADYFLNVQGDQIVKGPDMINSIIGQINGDLGIATLFAEIQEREELMDKNVVKLIVNRKGNIIYMSRYPIPYDRKQSPVNYKYYKQIGIYVFSKEALLEFASLEPTDLELMEGIELLRTLDYGYTIKGIYTKMKTQDVDVPEDIKLAQELIKNYPIG